LDILGHLRGGHSAGWKPAPQSLLSVVVQASCLQSENQNLRFRLEAGSAKALPPGFRLALRLAGMTGLLQP